MKASPWRSIRAALVFMTRLPVGGFPYSKDEFRSAPAHFPLAGLVVGALSLPTLWLSPHFGGLLTASLTLLVSVLLTGAFHEDGLADTADALGGAHSRKKIVDILKDSRIGTYGGAALCFSLLIRTFALAQLIDVLGPTGRFQISTVFVLVHVLARAGPVALMAWLPYVAGEAAKGATVAEGGRLTQALVAAGWAVLLLGAGVFCKIPLLLALLWTACSFVVSFALGWWFRSRAGGFTGDFLGATEQVLEMGLLLVALVVLQQPYRLL